MRAVEEAINRAVASGATVGAVALVANKTGTLFEMAAGRRSAAAPDSITAAGVFRIFSMTKAIASVAAMQLYERGQLDIEAAVETYCPEFARLQVLDGFDGEQPMLRAPKRKATVRHLLTHTSGLAYQFWDVKTKKYLSVTGNPGFLSGQKLGIMYPLTFDPGERWLYGINIDWLGQVIEAVSGKTLRAYCQDEIFTPLAMPDTDFECEGAARDRLATVHARGENGKLDVAALDPPSHPEVYGGGYGAYSTAQDYARFLRMILNNGGLDGVRVLRPETVRFMLQNHTGDMEMAPLKTVMPGVSSDAEFFPRFKKSHSLAMMRTEEPIVNTLAEGSHFWAGALNTYFWVDPARDVAGILLMQHLPFCDRPAVDALVDFQKAVYASL